MPLGLQFYTNPAVVSEKSKLKESNSFIIGPIKMVVTTQADVKTRRQTYLLYLRKYYHRMLVAWFIVSERPSNCPFVS